MTSNTTSNIIQMPAHCNQNLREDQAWKHHPAIATAWIATAIIIAWTEGKNLTVHQYLHMQPEMDPDIVQQQWHYAQAMACMTAMATQLPVPIANMEEPHGRT